MTLFVVEFKPKFGQDRQWRPDVDRVRLSLAAAEREAALLQAENHYTYEYSVGQYERKAGE